MTKLSAFLFLNLFVAVGCHGPVALTPAQAPGTFQLAGESPMILSAKPVDARRPDLIVRAFSTSPANPVAGDQVTFRATIQNVGQAATPAGVVLGIGFYTSMNSLMASSTTYSTSLPAGGTVQLVTNTSWTAQAGTRTVKAFVDQGNRIKESSESNNTLTLAVTVAPVPTLTPDLQITNIFHSPSNVTEGDSVSFTATVKNNGTGPTPAGTILSVVFKNSAGETIAFSNMFTDSVASGASVNLVTNSNWISEAGTHSILAEVDDANRIAESSESNNTLTFSVTVAPVPTLTPDLEITNVSHSPANVTEGVSVSFTATVKNNGTVPTPAGTILSVAYKNSAGETIAFSNMFTDSVAFGASVTLVTNSDWISEAGTHSIVAEVDDANRIAESSESNNTLTHAVSVDPVPLVLPDLVITNISHAPANPSYGDSVTFTATVKNNGVAPTPAGTILSIIYEDSGGETIAVSSTFTSSLAAGDSVSLETDSSWSAVSGTQTIMAVADDANRISETDETNNTLGYSVSVSAPPPATVNASPAYQFVDSIGVNTHFAFSTTPYYTQYPQVKARLLELGVRHIRDGSGGSAAIYKAGSGVPVLFNDLAASGIRLNLIANWRWTGTDILEILDANQASLHTIEGQNEADIFLSGDWVTIDRNFQMLLWNTVQGSSFSSLPVYLPSLGRSTRYATLGDLSNFGHFGNIHPYPGGNIPLTTFDSWVSGVKATSKDLPLIVTETGYHTAVKTTSTHLPISERGEAKYVPRMFLDYFGKGISRTYIYQFFDHFPPSTTNIEANFGLVRSDFSVRPSYTSLKNVIALLSDSSANVPDGGLSFSLAPTSTSVRSALFKKTNGNFYLILWQDVSVWNTSSRKDIVNPDVPVTVQLDRRKTVKLYKPSAGPEAQATFSAQSIDVDVPDEIVILEVLPE